MTWLTVFCCIGYKIWKLIRLLFGSNEETHGSAQSRAWHLESLTKLARFFNVIISDAFPPVLFAPAVSNHARPSNTYHFMPLCGSISCFRLFSPAQMSPLSFKELGVTPILIGGGSALCCSGSCASIIHSIYSAVMKPWICVSVPSPILYTCILPMNSYSQVCKCSL